MALLLIAAGASALRGGRFVYEEGNGAVSVAAARPATAVPYHASADGTGNSANGRLAGATHASTPPGASSARILASDDSGPG